MSRFLISCGGTGGHLAPGIALAEGLRDRGHETVLLVSRKQVDERLGAKYPHFRFERMPGTGFSGQPARLVRFLVGQAQAVWCCGRLLRRWRPEGVVGFGGFTSAAPALAARLLGVPVALHESNRVPGRAVCLVGRLAQRVYLPPGVHLRGIRAGATRHVGLPVRREIRRLPRAVARAALGLAPAGRLLVVLGGSQGAEALNAWAESQLDGFARAGIQLYVVTGLGKDRPGGAAGSSGGGEGPRPVFTPFCDRMAELLSAADLVVSRAGAGTLAELIRCETPAILVPYPQAADNHQQANAEFFERHGAGLVVPQTQLGGLAAEVRDVIFDDELLGRFRANLWCMDRADALEFMMDDLEELSRPVRAAVGWGAAPA